MSQPSREELLQLLTGEGFSGGAKSRKKRVPKGLKSWIAFRKKHPGMSIQQQSKLYKGKGMDGEDEEADDEYEYVIEGGKVRRRKKRRSTRKRQTRKGRGMDEETVGGAYPSSSYRTEYLIRHEKAKQLGEGVIKLLKKIFPVEWKRLSRKTGAGATEFDFQQLAKSDTGKTKFGKDLQKLWDEEVKKGTYESEREMLYFNTGNETLKLLDEPTVYLVETGQVYPGATAPSARIRASPASASASATTGST